MCYGRRSGPGSSSSRARGLAAGKLAVVELARETHPPLKVTMNLDPRASKEAREMVVSASASLLLYGLKEGREVRADAGLQRSPFPGEVTLGGILTWCASLQPFRAPDPAGSSVEIRPSTKKTGADRKPAPSDPPDVSEAQTVVLVSCHEFAGGSGPWMSPREEQEFVSKTEANGRRVARPGRRGTVEDRVRMELPRLELPGALASGLRGGRKRRPEDSVGLRAWVLAAVLVGEIAVLTSGYFDALTGVLVPLLTVVAFAVSHYRRREKNCLIKVMLAFFALALLAVFFREALSSLYDTRVPLARLFLWVQVIHAFDLPERKDLLYSLLSGLILLAAGAVLSTSLWYGFFVLALLTCASGALAQTYLSEARERASAEASESRGLVREVVAPGALAVVAVGFLCFSLLPQKQGMNLTMMPTSFFQEIKDNFSGGVQNSYYEPPGRPVLRIATEYLAGLLPRLQPVHGPPQPREALG